MILVHGTFAADRESSDDGERWWQRGSDTWNALSSQLPPGCSLSPESMRLFHWSGRNSQADRLEASTRLLATLVELERQGRGYHLVGHSHGGSIIWEALVNSVTASRYKSVYAGLLKELRARNVIRYRYSRHKEVPRILAYEKLSSELGLNHLRSWTTVGTPFLHHLPARRKLVNGWPSTTLSYHRGNFPEWQELAEIISVFVPMLGIMAGGLYGAGLAGRGQNPLPALLFAAVMGAFFLLAAWLVTRRKFAGTLLARERAKWQAYRTFEGRWLGLWAPGDEAIGVLSRLTSAEMYDYPWLCRPRDSRPEREPIAVRPNPAIPLRLNVPRTTVDLVPHSGTLYRFSAILAPAILALNRWVTPIAGKVVASVLVRTAQGTDLPGTVLAYVSTAPLPLSDLPAGLPWTVADRLEHRANEHAAKIGPTLRGLVALEAMDGVPSIFELSRPGLPAFETPRLLHTGYFEDADVLRLIVLHIARHFPDMPDMEAIPGDAELTQWLDQNARDIHSSVAAFFSSLESSAADTGAIEPSGATKE